MLMLIDCSSCPARGVRCADCMMTAMGAIPMGDPEAVAGAVPEADGGLPLDRAERRAVSTLLAAGLVTTETAHAARAVRDLASPRVQPGRRRAVG